ncbi:MAG: hypothetical protein KDA21_13270, partial [Phycisphaerales bacterium]|nr:hypothetical protein [Phycisphaerales bacterium]
VTNANRAFLGPRSEINPWTGAWAYDTSVLHAELPEIESILDRRIRLRDADLRASALTGGPRFFLEGYYVAADDTNVWNSAAWKPVSISGAPDLGIEWSLSVSEEGVAPSLGFAIDAWPGAMQTVIAEQVPVEEFVSPDGRAIIAAKAREIGSGVWRYEYAILNVDLDRQIDGWRVPLPPGAAVGTVGFHAPVHDGEVSNGPGGAALSNDAWTWSVAGGEIAWSTDDNPLRWGTLYNFWFEADVPPGDVLAAASLHRAAPGRVDVLQALTRGPVVPMPACPGDADGDGLVTLADLNEVLDAWGQPVTPPGTGPDVQPDGAVDFADLDVVLDAWGSDCRP